ncbi:flagellar filament capping protein FliD [Sinomonas halotolerans]|uniref:Flagellar hook-associated protein 2 n=1 Tax=Sinomonas halotolerans TaxID=1644133 RepID=A0ABU9WYT8_9MICC
MGMSIDGLATGLDTTSIINALMGVEAAPQQVLKRRAAGIEQFISALQSLNTKVADLATLAAKTATPTGTTAFAVASSGTAATGVARPTAQAGSVSFTVDALAQTHTAVTAAYSNSTGWPDSPATITITGTDGVRHEVTAASGSLDAMVTAVNAAGAGVTAVKVAAGVDGSGTQQYRLQFTATSQGAAGAFTVHRGTAADTDAGIAPDLFAAPGAAIVSQGQDAQVTLYPGTGAATTLTSSGNTFANLLPGLDATVSAVSATAVTLTVTPDAKAVSASAKALVDGLNGVFSTINSGSAVSSNATTGTTTAGRFVGDSTVRTVQRTLFEAASYPVGGKSPIEIGIKVQKDGTLLFDEAKFEAAYAADPAAASAQLEALSARVAAAAESVSDRFDGSLTLKIQSQQGLARTYNDQIEAWQTRLDSRRVTLTRIYAGLETAISGLNSQQAYLSSSLAALTASSGSES